MSEHTKSHVEEQLEELVKKKGGSSVVWNWFGFKISDINQKRVLFNFNFKGGNTSNLVNHLKNMHVRKYEECTQICATEIAKGGARPKTSMTPIQQSVKSSFAAGTPYDKISKNWKDITSAITHHIAKDMLSI